MTSHEKDTLIALAASTIVSIILNSLLVQHWGVEGAAIATTTSMILWNIILIIQVRRKLGIDPTILGKLNFL